MEDGAHLLKRATSLWYDVWKEAGYPTSGVMFQIKKHAKRRFKYEVLKRRHQHLLWSKFAGNFLTKDIKLSGPSFVLVISPGAKTIVFHVDGQGSDVRATFVCL